MFQGTFHLCPGCTRPGPHKPHGGVDDVPAFCAEIARVHCHSELTYHQREELEQYLICECWLLSEKYRAGVIRKGFSVWAGTTLRKRVTEWDQRIRRPRVKWQFKDRTYERPTVVVDSLDRVGAPEPSGFADGPDPVGFDFLRLLRTGDSETVGVGDGGVASADQRAA